MSGVNEIGASVVKAVAERSEFRAQRDDVAETRPGKSLDAVAPRATVDAAQAGAQPANAAAVQDAVKAINAQLQRVAQNLKFTVDQDSGRTVVKVVEGESGKVIRQIPSEEALAISEALEKMQGLIIQQKA